MRRQIGVCLSLRFLSLLFAALFVVCVPADAQLGTGAITGTVTDTSGAAVLGATVRAVNEATGFRRQTVVNEQGQYLLTGLAPGNYTLTVEYEGFRTYRQSQIILQVDQNLRINVALEVGAITETVEVTGQAPLVESETASMGAVLDQRKITDLPLNGREFRQLALLVPGANTGAPGADNGGGFTVSGLRAEQNAFQIDGTSNSDAFQNRITIQPNIDAIQEFKIQTNNYSAEFGKGAGAQVNLVTRSGTSELHGSVYEFLRNNKVQARRLFDRNRVSFPCDKNDPDVANRKACAPPWIQNQFGYTLGGPFPLAPRVDGERRTFFFTSYEGFRLRRGNATLAEVPTPQQRRADFTQNLLSSKTLPDALGRTWNRGQLFDPLSSLQVTDAKGNLRFVREPFSNNTIPGSRFDRASAAVLSNTEFWPLPNAPGVRTSNGNIRDNFVDGRSRSDDFDQFQGRIDHQASDNDTFFGRFSINDNRSFNPRTFPGFGNQDDTRTLNGTLNWTKVITPTTINEARFGYQGWFQLSASEDLGTNWHETFGISGFGHLSPDIQGSPGISITGFSGLGNGGGPLRRRNNTFQFIDTLSFNKGTHFLKAGFEVRRVRENVTRAQTTRGDFPFQNQFWTGIDGVGGTGHTLAAMQLGLVRQKGRRVSDFYSSLRATEYGAFIQDDWKATSNLTLNIGLRYMLYVPPYDTDDELSTMVSPLRCPSFDTVGCAKTMDAISPFVPFWGVAEGTAARWSAQPLPRSLSPTDKKDFGPRFGFAYRPFGGTTTVIRGGYGIFYDTVPMILTEDTIENWPYVIEDQQDLGIFQNGLPPAEGFFGFLIPTPGLETGTVAGVAGFQPGPNVYSPDFRNAYVQSWNFGIQRELPGNMVVEIAYAGNKGTRLNRRQNTNTAEPLGFRAVVGDLTNDNTVRDDIGNGRNQFRRLVPFALQNGIIVPMSNIFESTSTAFSNYHGVQLRLEKRYSSGVTFITTYTFSKAISDASGFNDGGDAGTGNRIQNILDVRADKGLADSDHRHRFTTAWVWDLPFGRNSHGWLKSVIGGWGIDGIASLQSGYPVTVRRAGDPAGIGTEGALRPDLVCNPNLKRGEQTVERFFDTGCFVAPESLVSGDVRFGTAGRTTVQGPGIINFDISARKVTALTERVNLEFRAEFFNSFNHPSWLLTGGSRDFGNSSLGTINGVLDPRIIQFGLKLKF